MKEINTTTIYSEKLVKKFLKDFYFERIKYVRILLNILIVSVIIYFFTNYYNNATICNRVIDK